MKSNQLIFRCGLAFWLTCICTFISRAQPQAGFTVSKESGCSPLIVNFVNTTSGASANATYQWDLGNGNSAGTKDAAAVYIDAGSYTVVLTVKDGSYTVSQSKTITVYRKPEIDLGISSLSGCIPFNATFNAISPDMATISSYRWDFGDGNTGQYPGPAASHTYTVPQSTAVTLTATSIYGCSNTVVRSGLTVLSPVSAAFIADKTVLCAAPGTVKFTNNSFGPGPLLYEWDFGDGNKSQEISPSHTYDRRGSYTVTLVVKNDKGCSGVFTRPAYINVANFDTDFEFAIPVCTNSGIGFTNVSRPVPDQCTWLFDGLNSYTTYGNSSVNYAYGASGSHTVQLTANYAGCVQTISKTIDVKSSPALDGFISEPANLCGAPVQVNFRDTTPGAVRWQWNFDWYGSGQVVHSTEQKPVYTYSSDYDYTVLLTVANADGCTATRMKTVHIGKPLVGIFLDPASTNEGCSQLTVKFMPRATEGIISYSWNFGDGFTSTDPQPVHTFSQVGEFTVTLSYTTANGCNGTATYNSIKVRQKPRADFSVQPVVCGNTPVIFTNTTSGYANWSIWDFGDNSGYTTSSPQHQYWDEGQYSVTLIAYNGLCNDTIVKTNVIKVLPPFTKITGVGNTCEGDRGAVTFSDASRLATSWHWDFGDAQSSDFTAPVPSVVHNYNASGSYRVSLTTINGACAVKDSVTVYVQKKQQPQLSASASAICLSGGAFDIQVTNYRRPVLPPSSYPPDYYYMVLGHDGNNFNGSFYSGDWNGVPFSAKLYPAVHGDDTMRVLVTSAYFGCTDTTNTLPIRIKGPAAAFRVQAGNVCFKSPAVFEDMSQPRFNIPIVKWEWDFGDNTKAVYTQNAPVLHRYANPGLYYVSLKVTDQEGCSSVTSYYDHAVNVTGPRAAFSLSSGSVVELNTSVSFFNNSNTAFTNNVSWSWDFGNSATSTGFAPTYTFTVPGDYVVTLIAENGQSQCRDTARQNITVGSFNSGFTKAVSFIGDNGRCPPVLVSFTNTSNNYIRLLWDFGDGFSSENLSNPSHVYRQPGSYEVRLTVYGYNGLVSIFRDTVVVEHPGGSLQAATVEGCTGHEAQLSLVSHTDAGSWIWDFGDGQVAGIPDTSVSHPYLSPGTYLPSAVLIHSNGCSVAVRADQQITIHPDPVISILPLNPVSCKGQPVQLEASGAADYEWSPLAGLAGSAGAAVTASPAATITYKVRGTDIHGCQGQDSVTVTVPDRILLLGKKEEQFCSGGSVQLDITGASSYNWIDVTDGLNNTQIGNPQASPSATTTYTVVGFDVWNCYSDTAGVRVTVFPLPSVNAGADRISAYGAPVQLSAINSNDVIKWNWAPARYLDCTNCPSPVSRPLSETDYVVTVTNDNHCVASDTVNIKMICAEGNIQIPNAFTPNRDGINDIFTVNGHGVRSVRSLRIYNRWGEIVFQRKDIIPNDNSSGWNGRFKGIDAPAGTYVYFAELECEAGQVFERKGTVTLVR